jgi:RNA polymerase subunit RPABC4/transcription elongation factor Spt4
MHLAQTTTGTNDDLFGGFKDFFHSGTWLAIRNVFLFFLVIFWAASAYWVYKDARRRIEDERELEIKAMEESLGTADRCPVCRAVVDSTFLACPVCTTKLKEACRRCKAPLEPLWQICPYCETPVESPRAVGNL